MHAFTDDTAAKRFAQDFDTDAGTTAKVFCDYAIEGGARLLLHVEADPALRGKGASGQFMQNLADHARAEGLRLTPRCSYAVAWFERHKDQRDLLA